MSSPTLQPAAELCESLGIEPSSILRAVWNVRLADGASPARWTVQVRALPELMSLLDLHPWEEITTDRHKTYTVELPGVDLVWSIARQPIRTVRRG